MRKEHRTAWWLWTCDGPACGLIATTHRDIEGADVPPVGWLMIDPPAPWRGPALAFHESSCRDRYIAAFTRDIAQLLPATTNEG